MRDGGELYNAEVLIARIYGITLQRKSLKLNIYHENYRTNMQKGKKITIVKPSA